MSEDIQKFFSEFATTADVEYLRANESGSSAAVSGGPADFDIAQAPKNADPLTARNLSTLANAIREHDNMLVGWLARKFGDADTARDIAQESYLRVWRFAQNSTVDNPRALIFKTAANLAANEFRSRKRWKRNQDVPVEGDEAGEQPIASEAPSPERTLCAKSDAAVSLSAIEAMPEKVRRAFIMSRFEEMTYREIAGALSVSVSSVEKYIITALVTLRAAVDEVSVANSKKIIAFPKNGAHAKKTNKK